MSYTAAIKLDIIKNGTGLVEVKAIETDTTIKNFQSNDNKKTFSERTSFYIQVGTFSKLENAQVLEQKLKFLDNNLIKISSVIVSGNTLYRVRIGPFNDTKVSDSIVSKLSSYGILEHRIVTN